MPASYTMQTVLSSYFLGVKGRACLVFFRSSSKPFDNSIYNYGYSWFLYGELYKGQGRRAGSRLQAWLDAKARKDRFSGHRITACLFARNRYYPDESYVFIACHFEQFDSHQENDLCEKSTDALKPISFFIISFQQLLHRIEHLLWCEGFCRC